MKDVELFKLNEQDAVSVDEDGEVPAIEEA